MDSSELKKLIGLLDDRIDDLEEALEPLTSQPVADTAGKLPLLDKAQLYILVTYALESMIFSYLRLHGVNAKDHPVFQELTRVKQYFKKIEEAGSTEQGSGPANKLDVAAANRFIKHALANNALSDSTNKKG